MRNNSNARTPATDFVQDYAAKKQAQIAKAKKIREGRLYQQGLHEGGGGASARDTGGSVSGHPQARLSGSSGIHSPLPLAGSSAQGFAGSGVVLSVVEEDFKQATQAGIITPDQARQLWAMLSNQIIRIDPSAGTQTVSVNSLLALSNASSSGSLPGSRRDNGGGVPTGEGFGASISLESLRKSIAQFKAQQRFIGAGGGSNTNRHAGPVVQQQLHYQAQPHQQSSQLTANAHNHRSSEGTSSATHLQQQQHLGYSDSHAGDDDSYEPDPHPPASSGSRKSLGGWKNKPQWNSDVTCDYDEPSDVAVPHPAEVMAPPARTAAKRPVAAAAAVTAPTTRQAKQQQPVAQRPAVATGSAAFDDVPVGGGGGGFSSWDDAYPPGASAPKPRHHPEASLAPDDNHQIEVEAAAAAREPLKECSVCGRSFRRSLLQRHEQLCRKQNNKVRNAFDMKAQRLDGVDGINEVVSRAPASSARKQPASSTAAGKMPKWKIQHEQFQAAMRAVQRQNATEASGGAFSKGGKLPPPPIPLPADLDDRVPCPHCGRKFAEEVAQRHIPKCATTIAKPKGIRPIRR